MIEATKPKSTPNHTLTQTEIWGTETTAIQPELQAAIAILPLILHDVIIVFKKSIIFKKTKYKKRITFENNKEVYEVLTTLSAATELSEQIHSGIYAIAKH